MSRKLETIIALTFGALLGVIGGMLFSPCSGSNVRRTISYRSKHFIEKVQELVRALAHTKTVVASQAKVAGNEVVEETITKAKQLLREANELAAQLEQ
jgi:gas vesicle protein